MVSLTNKLSLCSCAKIRILSIGLVAELLNRLSNAAGPQTLPSTSTHAQDGTGAGVSPHPKNQTTETSRSSQSISTTISLLSTLCRGSPTITYVCLHYK